MEQEHAFAVLAYKESPHLQECIDSLKKQTVESEIVVCTSTPSVFLEKIASKNNLRLLVNSKRAGIANDWNFALGQANAKHVTLAHQDDIYREQYAEKILEAMKLHDDCLIAFSDYADLVNNNGTFFIREKSLNFFVKRMTLRLFFRNGNHISKNKKWPLAFGNPIGCPAVTFSKKNIGNFEFDENFGIDLDWKAWHDLAEKNGCFIWIKKILVLHRIYAGSETTQGLAENRRQKEDLEMFQKFWPATIAKLLNKIYKLSYKNNNN